MFCSGGRIHLCFTVSLRLIECPSYCGFNLCYLLCWLKAFVNKEKKSISPTLSWVDIWNSIFILASFIYPNFACTCYYQNTQLFSASISLSVSKIKFTKTTVWMLHKDMNDRKGKHNDILFLWNPRWKMHYFIADQSITRH